MKNLLSIPLIVFGALMEQGAAASLLLSSQFNNLLVVDSETGGARQYLTSLPGDPAGMELNSQGDLLLAVSGSGGKLLRINPLTAEVTQTFSVGANALAGLSLRENFAYIASSSTGAILRIDTDSGTVSEIVNSGLDFPYGLALGQDGLLYATELSSGEISAIDLETQVTTTVALGLSAPTDIAFSGTGDMYIAQNGNGILTRISPGADGFFGTADDTRADIASGLTSLFGLELLGGQLFFTRGGTDMTLSKLDIATDEVTELADLPQVGRWIATAPIPEATTFLLAGLGAVAILLRRRVREQ